MLVHVQVVHYLHLGIGSALVAQPENRELMAVKIMGDYSGVYDLSVSDLPTPQTDGMIDEKPNASSIK